MNFPSFVRAVWSMFGQAAPARAQSCCDCCKDGCSCPDCGADCCCKAACCGSGTCCC